MVCWQLRCFVRHQVIQRFILRTNLVHYLLGNHRATFAKNDECCYLLGKFPLRDAYATFAWSETHRRVLSRAYATVRFQTSGIDPTQCFTVRWRFR